MATTIYLVTPSFNAVETIDRTILSVVSQAGDFCIRYHVQDGCSTDGTVDRLIYWKNELGPGRFPIQNKHVHFSYASEPDMGMYDALIRGFEAMCIPKNSFMAWINADDVLTTGSCAFVAATHRQFTPAQVSWVGGSVAVLRDDMFVANYDRPISSEALRNGLSDGEHWPFVQQEGTYFRKWLWDAVQPRKSLLHMRLAGDWNLWRLFAHHASLIQAPIALGGFRLRDQQLSAKHRDEYQGEINSIISADGRANSLKKMVERGSITRRKIGGKYPGSTLTVTEASAYEQARKSYEIIFRRKPPAPTQSFQAGERLLFEGNTSSLHELSLSELMKNSSHQQAFSIFDHGWQFPAITEHHAAKSLRRYDASFTGFHYVAYPWATLIDKIKDGALDDEAWMSSFREFCIAIPVGHPRITVCQHIYARRNINLFREAGIRTVFWSHATLEDVATLSEEADAVRFLPFPLYPVQVTESLAGASPEFDGQTRPYLFSFIGARANQHYLTEARNWIIDFLADDERGLIIGRASWHYERVVYHLQVRGNAENSQAATLVDTTASDQFRDSLLKTTFSLCPAGSGPNSIRLWESIGAGAVPVILADTWAPPGDRRLWDMAAVFCKETPEAIKDLPDRLAEIAADPPRLAQMRHAMRQLWLLYGPQNFVNDILEFMLAEAKDGAPAARVSVGKAARPVSKPEGAKGARQFLLSWSSHLLLDPADALSAIASDKDLAMALDKACALDAGSGLPSHFRTVLERARKFHDKAQPDAPMIARGGVPKIALFGRHSCRTPLSYDPIRKAVGDRLEIVDDPARADLVVTGFNLDWRENFETLKTLLDRPRPPRLAVISEEPLWDVTWSGPFTGRAGKMNANGHEICYDFLGHETSDIFRFERLPYFVLTDNRFLVRYASLMARFAGMDPAELLKRWQSAPVVAAFFAEKRQGELHGGSFPDRDVTRLSGYRSMVAELSQGAGVLRVGKGWGPEVKRQDLPDWHLDKLAQLDARVRMVTAYENVHQRDYISEKIFDAFAVGGVPVYWAGPKHRIFEMVPQTAMLNTVNLEPEAAANRIAEFEPDLALAESWLETCARLTGMLADFRVVTAERRRVADAVLKEVLELVGVTELEGPPRMMLRSHQAKKAGAPEMAD